MIDRLVSRRSYCPCEGPPLKIEIWAPDFVASTQIWATRPRLLCDNGGLPEKSLRRANLRMNPPVGKTLSSSLHQLNQLINRLEAQLRELKATRWGINALRG